MIIIGLLLLLGWSAGVKIFYVTTGSMKPSIRPGDLVVSVPVRKVSSGDIVSFEQNNGTIVTHRVVGISENTKASYFETKGDNNSNSDPYPVSQSEIRGKVLTVLPFHIFINRHCMSLAYWAMGFLLGVLLGKIPIQKARRV